jgi:Flp pilus assembly protein TadG
MIARFRQERCGSAAAEFALALPMMLALMFGGFEAGHFFWTQHKLVKAVRDGARYASRLSVDDLCPALDDDAGDNIRNVTATGGLSGGAAKIPGWDPTTVSVTPGCGQFVNTGIYTGLGTNGPLVKVSATVTYPSLFNGLGVLTSSIQMSAESSAAVMGV